MTHPYKGLSERSFWRSSVSDRDYQEITDLWRPKFPISSKTVMATFGSCFAQHFSRALRERKYSWANFEKSPRSFTQDQKTHFNYEIFSARTANIYTTSLLKQWVSWASGEDCPPDEVWRHGDRYFDPFRPAIEPEGFESPQEVARSQAVTIRALYEAIRRAGVFVFTMGLTESWFNGHPDSGYEYPLCPGTLRGEFDEKRHNFVKQDYQFVRDNLSDAIDMIREINPNIKILLTVSPVPLAATKSEDHVLVATSASKAILRAVAQSIVDADENADYFPSFEIISNPVFKGAFFGENLRDVTPEGVGFVMEGFFRAVENEKYNSNNTKKTSKKPANRKISAEKNNDILCEEELLEAFAPKAGDT